MYKSHTEKLLSCIQRRKQRVLLWVLLNFLDPLLRPKLGIMLLFGNMEMIQLGTKTYFVFVNCYETQILLGLDMFWCHFFKLLLVSTCP